MTEDQIGVLATCCIIFLLALAVHAFFVVGKFAFVQLRKETLEEVVRDGEEQLKKVLPCYDNTGIFLSMARGRIAFGLYGRSCSIVFTYVDVHECGSYRSLSRSLCYLPIYRSCVYRSFLGFG